MSKDKTKETQLIFTSLGCLNFMNCIVFFCPLFHEHREYFYDWCEIGSIYGAPADCIWGGGRVEVGDL